MGATFIPDGGATEFTGLTDTPSTIVPGHELRGAYGGLTLENFQRAFFPEAYGAVGDGQKVSDGAVTASSTTLSSVTGLFASSDVGKAIIITGAGVAGAQLTTTIASFNSSTSIEMTASASTTVSSANVSWGIDDTAAIQDAINAAYAAGAGDVVFAVKRYLTTGVLTLKANVTLRGILDRIMGCGEWNATPAWNPETSTFAPTIFITNTTTEFITTDTTDSMNASVKRLILTYPNQYHPNVGTNPIAYPYTIHVPDGDNLGFSCSGCFLVNSYNGLKIHTSRFRLHELQIGALNVGIYIDDCWDFSFMTNIEMVPYWDIIHGIVPTGSSTFTTWSIANSIGYDIYLADGLMGSNLGVFNRHTGIRFQDNTTENRTGWSHFSNIMLDVVDFGIIMKAGGAHGIHTITNFTITAHVVNNGNTAIWLEGGGTRVPKMILSNGNVAGGTFVNGNLKVDEGWCKHVNVSNVSDIFNTFINGDTTPSVASGTLFISNNSSSTTITDFDGEVEGKVIEVISQDNNTTISGTGGIKLYGGAASIAFSADDCLRFRYKGTSWYQC